MGDEGPVQHVANPDLVGGFGLETCPVTPSCVTSSRSSAVLMEQAARAIAAFHPAVRGGGDIGRSAGRPLPEPLVGPSLVVVLQELR
jgi:hypothetical protein